MAGMTYGEGGEWAERIGFIDPDQGVKTSLATSIHHSPLRYAIVRSSSPRFIDPAAHATPFGAYNIDTGSKKTLETSVRDSRRFFSATFDSRTPRFTRPWSSPVHADAFYDPHRLKSFQPATVAQAVEASPQHYSILRSKYKRFPDRPPGTTEGPDVEYAVDAGTKASLFTAMLHSPITYRTMGAPTKKTIERKSDSNLGPGSYDFPYFADIRTSRSLHGKPLSSLSSQAPRFQRGRSGDASFGLGSTWTPQRDQTAWSASARTVNKAECVRPQYMPKAYEKELKKM